jgi:hypothetical protein
MTPLRLHEHSLVLPADGVLHVFSRRSLHDLKGKQVDRLHERLVPHLQGTLDEDDLVRAVPLPQAAAVRSYLAGLREAGALGGPGGADPSAQGSVLAPLDALGPHRTRLRFRVGTRTVEVSIGGAAALAPEAGAIQVCFVTEAEAQRVLLSPARPGAPAGRATYVVVEGEGGPPSAPEAELRTTFARWLLHNELDVLPERDRFRLFRLDAAAGDLKRLAVTEGMGTSHLRTLFEQLGVVRAAEVDQVPLVVATAALPFGGERATAFGVSSGAVQRQCLRTLLARVLLRSGAGGTPPVRVAGLPGEPRRPHAAGFTFASCRLELLLELAGRWAERRALTEGVEWEPVDLLRVASPHAATAYLQEVLRMRLSELPGELARTGDGLSLCRSGAHQGRSFVQPHALAQVLLRTAWQAFYQDSDVPGGHARALPACSVLDFCGREAVRSTLREQVAGMRRHGEQAGMAVERLRCRGVSVWVGHLEGVARPGGEK